LVTTRPARRTSRSPAGGTQRCQDGACVVGSSGTRMPTSRAVRSAIS
jgi:hypothetical protein